MEKNTNKTLYTVIAIVILVVLGFLIFGRNDDIGTDTDVNSDTTAQGTNNTGSTNTGANGGNTGNTVPSGTNNNTAGLPSDATLLAIMGNSKVRVPQTGVDVALTQGSAAYTNGTLKGTVSLGSIIGKIATTDGWDTFVNLTSMENGKTIGQKYIALFHVKNGIVTYTSAVLVGDNDIVKGIEAKANPNAAPYFVQSTPLDSKGYVMTVFYLDQRSGDPVTTTPTVSKDFQVNVRNHNVTR